MRVFEIYNATKRKHLACARLFYDEANDKMIIRISDWAQAADLPIMLSIFAESGKRTLPDKWARTWVEERIPPQGRQNLGEIMRAQGLDVYDEISLLASSAGRSAQDDFLVREVPPASYEYALVDTALDENTLASKREQLKDAHSAARSWCEVIGPEIARRRKSSGMTQRELAEKTGVEQAAISRIEQGKANPTIDTLDALARGVGFNLLVKIV